MDLKLNGLTALVTGASNGLGYACAKELAMEGAEVAICSRTPEKIQNAAREITAATNGLVHPFQADLTKEEDLERLIPEVESRLNKIDILVVSTGHPPTHPFTNTTLADWNEGNHLVLRPPIALTQACLPGMKKRKYGRIVFIGSIFGIEPEASSVVQSTYRTGLNALAKCVATETAAEGITVNVICPGYFDTPLVRELAGQYAGGANVSPNDIIDYWKQYSPVKKFGKPEDLGALVTFLASPRAEFITGTAITMDGGAVRQW